MPKPRYTMIPRYTPALTAIEEPLRTLHTVAQKLIRTGKHELAADVSDAAREIFTILRKPIKEDQ